MTSAESAGDVFPQNSRIDAEGKTGGHENFMGTSSSGGCGDYCACRSVLESPGPLDNQPAAELGDRG